MVQIVYEYTHPWPQKGVVQIEPPTASLHVAVSPDAARRKVNSYLATYVSMSLLAGKPALVLDDSPIWRIPMEMQLDNNGHVATFGTVDVDAQTRKIVPLTSDQIRTIQEQLNELLARLTPAATATS
jgi:hypothetical protein